MAHSGCCLLSVIRVCCPISIVDNYEKYRTLPADSLINIINSVEWLIYVLVGAGLGQETNYASDSKH